MITSLKNKMFNTIYISLLIGLLGFIVSPLLSVPVYNAIKSQNPYFLEPTPGYTDPTLQTSLSDKYMLVTTRIDYIIPFVLLSIFIITIVFYAILNQLKKQNINYSELVSKFNIFEKMHLTFISIAALLMALFGVTNYILDRESKYGGGDILPTIVAVFLYMILAFICFLQLVDYLVKKFKTK
jgi:magnesium-transporting ATPase (P-type)